MLSTSCDERVQSESHRKEKEALLSRQPSNEGASSDAAQRRQLQKDNAQLRVKITELLKELEEVRNEREQLGQPSDVVTRLQAKQIAQHAERNRALEVNASINTSNVIVLSVYFAARRLNIIIITTTTSMVMPEALVFYSSESL